MRNKILKIILVYTRKKIEKYRIFLNSVQVKQIESIYFINKTYYLRSEI